MLAIVGHQPALEPLAHHRGSNGEMQCGLAALRERFRIQLPFNGWRVFDNAEPSAAGEQAKVPWFLRRGRPMNDLDRVTLHDAVGISNPQLMLIDEQPVGRRFALEERDRSFNSPDTPDE